MTSSLQLNKASQNDNSKPMSITMAAIPKVTPQGLATTKVFVYALTSSVRDTQHASKLLTQIH